MSGAGQPRVMVVGAGPCGALIANLLGVYGVPTLIIDKNKGIIPYPRAVGVDDESLRALQAAGLADRAHSDMIQNQLLRYFDSTGRPLIDVAPSEAWCCAHWHVAPVMTSPIDRQYKYR